MNSYHTNHEIVLHHTENDYGDTWVHEKGRVRCISFAKPELTPVFQSCIVLDDHNKLIFNYTKMALGGLYLNPDPRQILMIGLGGASIANSLQLMFPDASNEIVEINPTVYDVAKKYFFFQPSNHTIVTIGDGISFLENAVIDKKSYDFIIVDAFNNDGVVPVFVTEEFSITIKKALSPGGVVVINTLFNSEHNMMYTKVFGKFISLQQATSREIIAINGDFPTIETIEQNASDLEEIFEQQGVMKDWLIAIFKQYNTFS